MNWSKDIFKNIGKAIRKIFFYFFSLIIIGVIAGVSFFLMVEQSNKPCDDQFIQGCIAAGLSEQSCKDKLY
ncbi:MAG: hypothetical protein IJ545_08530 [Alphaproteobacteria bacterium]|nr:hypothetical protein [Alphaproteobacteria bacterium]